MSEKHQLVLIEDDDGVRNSVDRALAREGYAVESFPAAEPALAWLRDHADVVLVITDLMLPGTDGFGVLKQAREIRPGVGVLIVTGHGSVESAVEAMKHGADDYLTKPVNVHELRKRVGSIVERHRLVDENVDLRRRLGEKFGRMIGKSKAMEGLFRQMELVAPTRSSVLIIGESGTGKELVANAIHVNSPRAEKRFLPINCAAIPAEILESELFGHERGSFTGAASRKLGMFELADGGTLFLDEIGDLPLEMQVKLLRVLESREFMRVGGSETIHVDIRMIAATNADLEAAVEAGRFRADLYYRLKVVTLKIPPIRERREDIALLAGHFLRQFSRENDREQLRFAPEALQRLVDAPWIGNVRELRNLIESLVVLTPRDEIEVQDLPEEYRDSWSVGSEAFTSAAPSVVPLTRVVNPPEAGGPKTMEEIERRAILDALERTGGNRRQAADILGIGLRTLHRRLKEYRISDKSDR